MNTDSQKLPPTDDSNFNAGLVVAGILMVLLAFGFMVLDTVNTVNRDRVKLACISISKDSSGCVNLFNK